MGEHCWDTLLLTLSTDETGQACVREMIPVEDMSPGYNIMRDRRFNRDRIDIPEVVVRRVTGKELEFDIFYSGEEDLGSTAILDIGNTPEMVFTIGTADCRASLGLCLLALDDSDA